MFIYESKKVVDNEEVEVLNVMFQSTQIPAEEGTDPDVALYKDGEGTVHVAVSGTDLK